VHQSCTLRSVKFATPSTVFIWHEKNVAALSLIASTEVLPAFSSNHFMEFQEAMLRFVSKDAGRFLARQRIKAFRPYTQAYVEIAALPNQTLDPSRNAS
jgi:hypothetical protein